MMIQRDIADIRKNPKKKVLSDSVLGIRTNLYTFTKNGPVACIS